MLDHPVAERVRRGADARTPGMSILTIQAPIDLRQPFDGEIDPLELATPQRLGGSDRQAPLV